jgi:hypothetical protein
MYYDLEGMPIGRDEWIDLSEDTEGRRIGLDFPARHIRVSTVWLGLDHGLGRGPPLIFETMIFGGRQDEYQERYTTKEQAALGHAQAVRISWTFRDKFLDALRGFVPEFPLP